MSILLTVLIPGSSLLAGPEVNEENVQRAIEQAVKCLYSASNPNDVWDLEPQPKVADPTGVSGLEMNWGGKTALVLTALASAGQEGDPRFQKALAWLMKQDLAGTYALGLRMQLVHHLRNSKDYFAVLKKDGAVLERGLRSVDGRAFWSYLPGPAPFAYTGTTSPGDYSNTNYAILGLWAAKDEGLEIARPLWLQVERAWTDGQHKDGSWSYFPAAQLTPQVPEYWRVKTGSMTTAAIASLYLVIDECYARQGEMGTFRNSAAYKSIQGGLKWMEGGFDAKENPGWPEWAAYYFYNCEWVGAAAGLKYFGKHDWFREIAATILASQREDGAILLGGPGLYGGTQVDTAYALLFLAKGSAPIVMNKLQHAGDWDNHLRELAAMTGWLAHQSERPANWQVVNLKGPAEDLTDSRILYIAGVRALSFSEEEKKKLKRYVELGGLLVFHPDKPGSPFAASAGKLLAELWPDLERTPVDLATHPLATVFQPLGKKPVRIEQLASPVRVLAFILGDAPATDWERREYTTKRESFALGGALHFFANDAVPLKELPTKLAFFGEPFRKPVPEANRTVTLARIRYHASPLRWDPEPLAFERFARVLAERENVRCEIKVVTPAELAASGAKFAHITGWDDADLSAEQSAAIQAFLKAGGILLADQAGGPPRNQKKASFDDAIHRWAQAWYGPVGLKPMSGQEPVLGGLEKVVYRNVANVRRRKMPLALEHVAQGGRTVILYSKYDITTGLLGCPNPMGSGIDPEGCYQLLARILTGAKAPATP